MSSTVQYSPTMPANETTREILVKLPIFAGLAPAEMDFLAQHALSRTYVPGQIIFNEGGMHWALRRGFGSRSDFQNLRRRTRAGVEHRWAGQFGRGTLPVFDGGEYPASVTAVDAASLLFVSKQVFQELCLAHPQVALKVLRVVGGRLRRLVGIIEELSFTTVRHRLAAVLLRLAKNEGTPLTDGKVVIRLPENVQEVACRSGPYANQSHAT